MEKGPAAVVRIIMEQEKDHKVPLSGMKSSGPTRCYLSDARCMDELCGRKPDSSPD